MRTDFDKKLFGYYEDFLSDKKTPWDKDWEKTLSKRDLNESTKIVAQETKDIIECAKAGHPEAIYLVAGHRALSEEIIKGKVISEDLLTLYGTYPNSIYTLHQYQEKNKTAKEKIESIIKERQRIIIEGTDDYNEDTTWTFIKTKILPYATKDIWETINDIYNREDACVPDNDKASFNVEYEKYLINIGASNKGKKESKTKKVSVSQKEKDSDFKRNFEVNKNNIEFYKSKLLKKTKSITEEKLFLAINALLLDFKDDADCSKILESIENVLTSSSNEIISVLFAKLEFKTQQNYINLILDFLGRDDLSENWKKQILYMFENSLDSDYNGYWISILEQIKVVNEYASKFEFWDKFKTSAIRSMVVRFYSCLTRDSFIKFYSLLKSQAIGHKSEQVQMLINVWNEYVFKALFALNNDDRLRILRNYIENEEPNSNGDWQFMFERLFLASANEIDLKNQELNRLQNKEYTIARNIAEEFAAAFKSIEEIEKIASKLNDKSNDLKYSLMIDLVGAIQKCRTNFAYFLDHNWNLKLEQIETLENFLTNVIQYNPNIHSSENLNLKIGDTVSIKTFGLRINGEIKYKAQVEKEE